MHHSRNECSSNFYFYLIKKLLNEKKNNWVHQMHQGGLEGLFHSVGQWTSLFSLEFQVPEQDHFNGQSNSCPFIPTHTHTAKDFIQPLVTKDKTKQHLPVFKQLPTATTSLGSALMRIKSSKPLEGGTLVSTWLMLALGKGVRPAPHLAQLLPCTADE